ncbi:hypothetical protein GN956_G14920 [Arapaima gigas]
MGANICGSSHRFCWAHGFSCWASVHQVDVKESSPFPEHGPHNPSTAGASNRWAVLRGELPRRLLAGDAHSEEGTDAGGLAQEMDWRTSGGRGRELQQAGAAAEDIRLLT